VPNIISAYTPQVGHSDAIKKKFWDDLDEIVRECPTDQHLFIGGDLNGHIGFVADGYAGEHGGFGFGARNEEGRAILEFATAHDLVVANSFFKKREAHLITFQSGSHNTQIDFLLVRRGDLRMCKDCRAFPSEACSSQHRLVTLDVIFERQRHRREATGRARILWKNLKGDVAETFKATVSKKLSALEEDMSTSSAEQMWNTLAHTIKDVARDSLGVVSESARSHSTHRESWWFSEEVQTKVAAKQSRFKELLSCHEGNLEGIDSATKRYKLAKREAKIAVARAKDKAYEDLYKKLDSKEGANDIYKIAKARERRRRDLGNVRYIKDEGGKTIDQPIGSTDCIAEDGEKQVVGPDQIPIEAWKCLKDEGVKCELTGRWRGATQRASSQRKDGLISGGSVKSFPFTRTRVTCRHVATIGVSSSLATP
ncbi:tyrosyl-DNA phosphodiesterase 1, partial [Tanacetum coccineum]